MLLDLEEEEGEGQESFLFCHASGVGTKKGDPTYLAALLELKPDKVVEILDEVAGVLDEFKGVMPHELPMPLAEAPY